MISNAQPRVREFANKLSAYAASLGNVEFQARAQVCFQCSLSWETVLAASLIMPLTRIFFDVLKVQQKKTSTPQTRSLSGKS